MLFSIVVPVYNVENYLRECVESIIAQNGIDFEIILVDDGSTDQSAIICDKFSEQHENISVVHKENEGLSSARNVGVKNSKGDYILFVDGDDYIEKNSLQEISTVIKEQNYPNVVCMKITKFVDGSENIIVMENDINKKINGLYGVEFYNYLSLLPKYPASACNKAIKREFFLEYDLFFVKGLLAEDLEWGIRLFLATDSFAYCPSKFYYYRLARSGSISSTSSEKRTMDILATFLKWTSYAGNMQEKEKKRMVCSYMEYIFRLLILGYDSVEKKKRKEYRYNLKRGTWVMGTRKDKISRCINLTYRVCGIRFTNLLLHRYIDLRQRVWNKYSI